MSREFFCCSQTSLSSTNSRGVAILTDFALRVKPTELFHDPEENFLFIRTVIHNTQMLLGSVYGPNNTGRDLYRKLGNILERNRDCKVIIGGDWNTVWDKGSLENNIDIFKMQSLPNKCNRDLLRDMATRFSLFDPTRVLYPEAKLFTYTPFGFQRNNKSRLDFFVLSGDLLPSLVECKPSIAVATNLFDHRSVALFLGAAPVPADRTNPRLRNTNLDNLLVQNFTNLSAYRCYSFGIRSEPDDEPNAPIRETISNIRTITRTISTKLTEVSDLLRQQGGAESTLWGDMLISALYAEIHMSLDELPSSNTRKSFTAPKKNG